MYHIVKKSHAPTQCSLLWLNVPLLWSNSCVWHTSWNRPPPPISFLGCAYFGLFKRQTYYTSYTHPPVFQSPFVFPMWEPWKVSEYCQKSLGDSNTTLSLEMLSCKGPLQGKVSLLASTQRISKWRGLDASYQQVISPEVFKNKLQSYASALLHYNFSLFLKISRLCTMKCGHILSTFANICRSAWETCLRILKNEVVSSLMLHTTLLQFQCTSIHKWNKESNVPRNVIWVQINVK